METDRLTSPRPAKRSRSEMEVDENKPIDRTPDDGIFDSLHLSQILLIRYPDTSSDDDGFGPALPSTAPKKKRRKLPYEKLYIAALPTAARYSKSLMHRDQLCFTTFTPLTDFLITSSVDGVVKFWKKDFGGIEFVKEFRAHNGEIKSVSVSADGRSFASAGADRTIKIFDVITFGSSTNLIRVGL